MPKEIFRISSFEGGTDNHNDPRTVPDNALIEAQEIALDKLGKVTVAGTIGSHTSNAGSNVPSGGKVPAGGGLLSFSTDESGDAITGGGIIYKTLESIAVEDRNAEEDFGTWTGAVKVAKAVPGMTYYITLRLANADGGYKDNKVKLVCSTSVGSAVVSHKGNTAVYESSLVNNDLAGSGSGGEQLSVVGYSLDSFPLNEGNQNLSPYRIGEKVSGDGLPAGSWISDISANGYEFTVNGGDSTGITTDASTTLEFDPFFTFSYANAGTSIDDILVGLHNQIIAASTDNTAGAAGNHKSFTTYNTNTYSSDPPAGTTGNLVAGDNVGYCEIMSSSGQLGFVKYIDRTSVKFASGGAHSAGGGKQIILGSDSSLFVLGCGAYLTSSEDFSGEDWLVYAPNDGSTNGLYFWNKSGNAWERVDGSSEINEYGYDYISGDNGYTDFYIFDGALRMCSSDHNSATQKALWYGYIPKKTYFKGAGETNGVEKERIVGGFWWGDVQELSPPVGVFSNASVNHSTTRVSEAPGTSLSFQNTGGDVDQIVRDDGGSFAQEGFKYGHWIKITGAPPNDTEELNGIFQIQGVSDSKISLPGNRALGEGNHTFNLDGGAATGVSGTKIANDEFFDHKGYPRYYSNYYDISTAGDRPLVIAFADDTSEEGYFPDGEYEFFYTQVYHDGQESALENVYVNTQNFFRIGGTSTFNFMFYNKWSDYWNGYSKRGFRVKGNRFYLKEKAATEYHLVCELDFAEGVRLGEGSDSWTPWGYFHTDLRRGYEDSSTRVGSGGTRFHAGDSDGMAYNYNNSSGSQGSYVGKAAKWNSDLYTYELNNGSHNFQGIGHTWRCPPVEGYFHNDNSGNVLNDDNSISSGNKNIKKSDYFSIKGLSPSTYYSMNGYSGDKSTSATWKCSTVLNRRVYIGNVKQDGIVYADRILKSPPNKPDTFPANSFVEASVSDGDEIVQLEGYADRILQFNKNNLHVINVSQDFEFLESSHAQMGVNNPAATCMTDKGIVWANNFGCFMYGGGGSVQDLTEREGIPIIDRDIWDDFIVAPSVGFDPKFKKVIVIDNNKDSSDATLGNAWIYDMVTGAWTYHDSYINVGRISNIVNDSLGQPVFVTASSTGSDNTSLFKQWKPDTSESKNVTLVTKDYDFGTPGVNKKVYKIYVTYKGGTSQDVAVTYKLNGAGNFLSFDAALNDTGTTGALIQATLKPSSPINNIKSIQFKLYGIAATTFELVDISVVYRTKRVK